MVKLSVIVLCYHGDRWIGPCMESLENQSLDRNLYEIILVDNGGSTPLIHRYKNRNHVKVVYLKENKGFAGGNNRALTHANGDIIFLVNQDVVVHRECLQRIREGFSIHPAAGIVSANMQMRYANEMITPSASQPVLTGIYRISCMGYAVYELKKTGKGLVPVDFVSGNGLGFKASILKSIGNYLFDSRLRSYAEDLDLSLRAMGGRWKMFVCPSAIIYHFRDKAFSGNPVAMIRKFLHVSSNRLLVYYHNFKPGVFLKKLPFLVLGIPLKVGRPDGEKKVSLIRIAAGFLLLPLALLWFVIKATKSRNRTPA